MSNREINQAAKDLIAAKKLIENPKNWCRDQLQRYTRTWYGKRYAQYCALGALQATRASSEAGAYLCQAAQTKHGTMPDSVNDLHGHGATMEMFDYAISLALSGAKPKYRVRRADDSPHEGFFVLELEGVE